MTKKFEYGWKPTRFQVKRAASVLAEGQESSWGVLSPGKASVTADSEEGTFVKSSASIVNLIQAYLNSTTDDEAWCLPTLEECSGSFTPRAGSRSPRAELEPGQRRNADNRKKIWFDNHSQLRTSHHEFVELK
jgi:hypothetical protein